MLWQARSGLISGRGAFDPAAGGGGGDAAETTAFLARTSGLSGTEIAVYKALINGLVADGIFSILDALYFFGTNTTATASLNLCSTNYGLTFSASYLFTADLGYTGLGPPNFVDTGFNPSTAAGNFSLNSATIGFIDQTASSSNLNEVAVGASSPFTYAQPVSGGTSFFYDINGSNFPNFANTSAKGVWTITRTGASALAVYKNGSATAVHTSSGTSSSMPNNNIYLMGLNNAGVPDNQALNDVFSAFWIGGGMTGAQASALHNRVNTALTAFSANIY